MRTPSSPSIFPTLSALAILLAACGGESPTTTSSAAPSSAPVATTTATASATSAASEAVSAAPAPTSTEAAEPTSPEPTLKEWDAAKQDLSLVAHWDRPGCTGRRVREWVRVGCGGQMLQKGAPLSITIEKGFKARPLDILNERGGSIWLIFPFTEGTDGAAVYAFEGGSFRFTAKWPHGAPEPKTVGDFDEVAAPAQDEPSEVADPAPADPAPAATEAAKPAKPTLTTDPLPEEPKLDGAPTVEQWDAVREVGVSGSDARGCQTKQSGDWFRVVCRANDVTGKVTSATATKGFDEKQGYVVVGNGSMVMVTRYVRGSDIAFDLVWEKQSASLKLVWPEASSGPPGIRGTLVAK